jgi:hypothetical protein
MPAADLLDAQLDYLASVDRLLAAAERVRAQRDRLLAAARAAPPAADDAAPPVAPRQREGVRQ